MKDLENHAIEQHAAEVAKINIEIATYSTKLTGLLKMLEVYFVSYTQAKKEMVNFAHLVSVEVAEGDPGYLEQINRVTRNKLNKIDNRAQSLEGFLKRSLQELTVDFNAPDLDEGLLDAFDKFWEETVEIDAHTIRVKKSAILKPI